MGYRDSTQSFACASQTHEETAKRASETYATSLYLCDIYGHNTDLPLQLFLCGCIELPGRVWLCRSHETRGL